MRTLADYRAECAADQRAYLARMEEGWRATLQMLIDHPDVTEEVKARARAVLAEADAERYEQDTLV